MTGSHGLRCGAELPVRLMTVGSGRDEDACLSRFQRSSGPAGAVVGLILAGLIAGHWVGRGQVLLLDWVSGPHAGPIGPLLGTDGNTLGGSPLLLVHRALRSVVGPSASSWIPVVAWMPLVGFGVGQLTRRAGWPAAASAAALACCNPFTLDRLAVGQVGVLWAYALFPLAVLTFTTAPRRLIVWAARCALVGAGMTAMSPHFFAYWVALQLVGLAVLPMAGRRALGAVIAVLGALCASSYLFVIRQPSLVVGHADLGAYRTRSEPPGLAVTLVTLRGFWRQSGVTSPRSSASWALVVLLGACAAVGLASAWRRREALVLVLAGLIGIVLAAGDQGPLGGLYRFAFENVGPFRILREPQKASALLAIALSVFFGFGVAKLVASLTGARVRVLGAVILVPVPLGTAPAFATFGARADVEQPSASWQQADRLVGTGPAGVLALPWHLYLGYPSTRSPVANLAPTRFRVAVASGDNVELPGIETTSNRRRSAYLEGRFRQGAARTDFGAQIEPAGLGWVLLVKTVDWTSYEWLDRQADLERVLDTPELALYRSTAETDLSPGSAERESLAGWRVSTRADRPLPIPEVAEGRWFAEEGSVETNIAGAPAVKAPGTSVRSRNVQNALRALALSGAAMTVLTLLAFARLRPARRGAVQRRSTTARA